MTELINAEQLDEIARRHYRQAGPVVALIRAALREVQAVYEADREQIVGQNGEEDGEI